MKEKKTHAPMQQQLTRTHDWHARGRACYRANPLYRDLANVMTHPELRGFVRKYLLDPATFTPALLMLRTMARAPDNMDPYAAIGLIDEAIWSSAVRAELARDTTDFLTAACGGEPRRATIANKTPTR